MGGTRRVNKGGYLWVSSGLLRDVEEDPVGSRVFREGGDLRVSRS